MKKRRNWLCMLFTVLIFTTASIPVFGEEVSDDTGDRTLSPYFYIEDADPLVDNFPLKETSVLTNINGVIAETYVTQTYKNEGKNPINASYVFPASTKVTVHGMKMEIGDHVVTAKIKEKQEAKEEFEQAKSEGKSSSLLEQERPNVFTMNVANIMPGDTVRLELHYTELIVPTEGTYQFVFPTVVGPRYASSSGDTDAGGEPWVASPYLKDGDTPPGSYHISVRLAAGVPITYLTSGSHKVDVAWEEKLSAQITLSSEEEFAGNRDFILDYKLTGQEISSGLMLGTGDNEKFFMLMVQPPERVKTEDIPPREYIFVLDVSGSMEGYPIDTAKELIKNLVANLQDTDRFNLILFSDQPIQMSPEPVAATNENMDMAVELIDQQLGRGGTQLAPALQDAITMPATANVSRSIVVITDGFISGEKEIFDIITKNLGTTNFFSFGIGTSVNRYLVDGIAKAGQGEAFVVTKPEEAFATAERFRAYIQSPVLTDITVSYNGFEAYDVEPATLPTLFAQRPIVLFGKWRGEPSGTIQITGKTGSQDYVQEIQVSETKPLETNSAIGYLWARTKVDRLMDYGAAQADSDAVKQEVTELGLKYSMMTPYTSFIAVLDTMRNTTGDSKDVKQPLPLPEDVSNLAVGNEYMIGSEPGSILLIAFVILLVFISGIYAKKRRNPNTWRDIDDDFK